MSRETVSYVSAMQGAFINAVLNSKPNKTTGRVLRVSDRLRLAKEPAVHVSVSFRTAQKLKAEGVL